MLAPRVLFLLFLAQLGACAAVPPLPPATPELPLAEWEGGAAETPGGVPVAPAPRTAPRPALAKSASPVAKLDTEGATLELAPPSSTAQSRIPGGTTCLRELAARGVRFHASEPVLGIATPVVLDGTLRGIRFYAADKRPFVADCRLLLALEEVAADFRGLGVTEVRFSGAYVYKLTHPGRMSMHAYGLAVDLHAFRAGEQLFEVKHDFARRSGCGSSLLNQVACRVRAHAVFKELLGPDDNAAHFDHFHLGLKPLPGELATNLPLPAAPKRRPRPKPSKRR